MPLVSPVKSFPMPAGVPSGFYALPSSITALANSALATTQVNSLTPFSVAKPTRFDRIAINLITGQTGAEARLGIYADNNGTPFGGALLLDAGTISLATGFGLVEATIDITLAAGQHWAMCMNKAAATGATVSRISNAYASVIPPNSFTGFGSARAYTCTMAYGALDATCPAVAADGSGVFPVVGIRAA